MRSALTFFEGRQRALLFVGLFLVVVCLCILGIDGTPAWVKDGTARDFEFYGVGGTDANTSENGGLGIFAVGLEDGNEAACHEVVDLALHVGERRGYHACGDDGVVVGDLRRVEHLL